MRPATQESVYGRPTDDQTKLLDDLAYVHEVVQRLYLDDGLRPSGTKCRRYYVRLFRLAQNGLEGPDRLAPSVRLRFIGTLTMLFGMLFINGIVELKLGSHATAEIATDPAIAFIIGTFFGLSEAALPGITGKRVERFMKGLQ